MARSSADSFVRKGFIAFVGAVAALNVLKGIPHVVHDLGLPYWVLTYEHGFIRRALVGTIFQAFARGFDPETQRRIILVFHSLLAFALSAALLAWGVDSARRASTARARALVGTATAALFLSQLPTTISLLAGYLDVVVVALASLGAWLAIRGKLRAAGVVAAFGPLVHDSFVFLWLPVLLIAVRRCLATSGEERRVLALRALPLLSPALTSALTLVFHSREAAKRAMDALPVDEGVKTTFYLFQFGLSPSAAFAIMRDKLIHQPDQVALACAAFGMPAVAIAACGAALDPTRSRARRIVFAIAMTAAPCTILLVAWDLSRFLLWSTFGAFLLVMENAPLQRDTDTEPRRTAWTPAPALALAALCLLSTGPHLYAYFEVAFADYPFGVEALRYTPAAKLSYAFLNAYNRKLFVRGFASAEKCAIDAMLADKTPECTFLVKERGFIEIQDMWLSPGSYVATVATSPSESCSSGSAAKIAAHVPWRFGGFKPAAAVDLTKAGTTTLRFSIEPEEAAMGRARVRVWSESGCFRVEELRVSPE